VGRCSLTAPSSPRWRGLLTELEAFSLLVAFIVLLWRDNLWLFLVVLVEGLVVLGVWHDRGDLCFFGGMAVLGSVAEVVFVHFGVWRYANPTFLGIPLWFPLAFGVAVLLLGRLFRTFTELWP
jgi:hypothetical protein